MSDEFVRCPECGNLNIMGTKKCVFCDAGLAEAEIVTHEVEAPPEIIDAPPVDVPAPRTSESEITDELASPKLPDFEKIDQPVIKKKKLGDITIEDSVGKQYNFGQKLLFISLLTILVSLIHYALNFLIGLASIDIIDENLNIIPIPANLLDFVQIRGLSFLLGIPFAIIIGYILGKIVRKFTTNKKSLIKWIAYAYFLDVVLNIVFAVVLVVITNALNEKDILFTWITGAIFIFLVTLLVTLFIPMISGSFLIFTKIDKIFFRSKYVD